jgi:hypothetical protein
MTDMAKLFQSLKQIVRDKLRADRSSGEGNSPPGHSTEKEAEQAPPERVGEVVGHSSGG